MKLEIANYPVQEIILGTETHYSDGALYVNPEDVRAKMLDETYFDDISVHVAHPGDSTRIVHIVDAIEPRAKQSDAGCIFPGVLGPPENAGRGRTSRLSGMAVVSTSEPAAGESFYWREAILDMSGPGARYSDLSQTANLVVELSPRDPGPNADKEDIETLNTLRGSPHSQRMNTALRKGQMALATYLAETASGMEPASIDSYELTDVDASLPRVAYGCQVVREHVYGATLGWQPTFLHPNEILDGALYNPFNYVASVRATTYHYQNNPLLHELYSRHGTDLNFLGVLLVTGGATSMNQKNLMAGYSAKLLRMLKADGVVLSWIGGGHMAVDVMLLVENCERAGIGVSLICPEMARSPDDQGFVHFTPEAEAIVSTGNFEEQVVLPGIERVIGGDSLFLTGDDPREELTVRLGQMLGATQTFGMGKLSGTAY